MSPTVPPALAGSYGCRQPQAQGSQEKRGGRFFFFSPSMGKYRVQESSDPEGQRLFVFGTEARNRKPESRGSQAASPGIVLEEKHPGSALSVWRLNRWFYDDSSMMVYSIHTYIYIYIYIYTLFFRGFVPAKSKIWN